MDVRHVEQNIEVAVVLLKAMSNENRLRIICSLYKGEKSVRELEKIVGLSQSALSQHLCKLREDKLVTTRREAQTVYYSLADERITDLLHTLYDIYSPQIAATG